MGTQNLLGELEGDLAQERLYSAGEIRGDMKRDEVVGKSAALRCLLNEVETVAPTESTVLICGETGTGKETLPAGSSSVPGWMSCFLCSSCGRSFPSDWFTLSLH
jgi:transcriptional regulator of aromatic amino acid metabolism